MAKGEGVIPYLTHLTQIGDTLRAIVSKTEDSKFILIAINGFSKSWDSFVCGIVAREKLPNWQCLWDDFVQEEIHLGQASGSYSTSQVVDKEALVLASKGKGKPKKKCSSKKKNMDLSKVKRFQCHKFGHFASQCPEKKKSKP
jgi:hypothetical protein